MIHNDYSKHYCSESLIEQSELNSELLAEIKRLSSCIEQTEPLVAKSLEELHSALKAKNQPRVMTILKELSKGTVASLLANIASEALRHFIGIG